MNKLHTLIMSITMTATSACAQEAQFLGLGDLPGGVHSSAASDLSRDGLVVTGLSVIGANSSTAFLWTPVDGMTALGHLPGGRAQSGAAAVSPEGRWVVGQSDSAAGNQAFAWSEGTGIFGLGDLPGGKFESSARSVSRNGRVIVGKGTVSWNGQDASEAFRWSRAGGMVGMGTLPTTDRKPSSTATDISADGNVIVGGSTITGGGVAFRWTEETGMVALESLSDDPLASYAEAVSADGMWAVGRSYFRGDDGVQIGEAVMWDPLGNIIELGFLDDGVYHTSEAADVALGGRAVVGSASINGSPRPFLWTPEDGMRSIVSVLLEDYGIDVVAAGWRLAHAEAITPDGRTIVGWGTNPTGGQEAWMVRLPVPAPSTLPPLAIAALLATRRRRHG